MQNRCISKLLILFETNFLRHQKIHDFDTSKLGEDDDSKVVAGAIEDNNEER